MVLLVLHMILLGCTVVLAAVLIVMLRTLAVLWDWVWNGGAR